MRIQQRLLKLAPILLILSTIGCGKQNSNVKAVSDNATAPEGSTTEIQQKSEPVKGQAAWYGPGYYGKKTTSGEILKEGTMTAAHSSLPMGTRVKVTRLDNNESVTVVINDRKPYRQGTVIDLAHGAAVALDVDDDGKTNVEIEVLEQQSQEAKSELLN